MAGLALSSWAVHHWITGSEHVGADDTPSSAALDRLCRLPGRARSAGFEALEICDFHLLPERTCAERLRAAAEKDEVELFQLLIDHGDIASPSDAEAHIANIATWIEIASWAGFSRVRIIAGQQPPSRDSIQRAIEGLGRLSEIASNLGVAVSTENWHALMATPEIVEEIVTKSGVGLVCDFGNWTGTDKLHLLRQIMPLATSCHAKCEFDAGVPRLDEFAACLRMAKQTDFDGYLTLVHGESTDEWASLLAQRQCMLDSFFHADDQT